MLQNDGKYICDAEVGTVRKGWHGCRAHARFKCQSAHGNLELHYCNRHKERAGNPKYTKLKPGTALEPIITLNKYTVRILNVPPVFMEQLGLARVTHETRIIEGYSMEDAKRRAGII